MILTDHTPIHKPVFLPRRANHRGLLKTGDFSALAKDFLHGQQITVMIGESPRKPLWIYLQMTSDPFSFQATHRTAIAGGRVGDILWRILLLVLLSPFSTLPLFPFSLAYAGCPVTFAKYQNDSVLLKNVMVQNPDLQPKASMEVSHGSRLPSFGPTAG